MKKLILAICIVLCSVGCGIAHEQFEGVYGTADNEHIWEFTNPKGIGPQVRMFRYGRVLDTYPLTYLSKGIFSITRDDGSEEKYGFDEQNKMKYTLFVNVKTGRKFYMFKKYPGTVVMNGEILGW